MLLLCALIAGSSVAWGQTDVKYTFNSKSWGATVGSDDANWTSGKDGNALNTGRGVQVTTGVSGANATSPTSLSNISKIVVTYSTNASAGAGSISFQIGSGTAKSQNVTKTGGTTDRTLTYNFSPNETGKVKITVACTTNSIYVKDVTITYTEGAPKAANEIAWNAATKDVTYSVEPYGLPVLSNPHSLPIEYSSSDTSVASIDSETGVVTINNVTGSTTITASTVGDADYAAGAVSYTLNVTRKVILEDGVFDFSYGEDYGSEAEYKTSSSIDMTETTWTSGDITLVIGGRNIWEEETGYIKLYKATASQTTAGNITVSCPSGKVITKILLTGPYSGTGSLGNLSANIGDYIVTSESAIWTGIASNVKFTASNSTYIGIVAVTYGSIVPVKVSSAGWASFSAGVPLDFTGTGVTAYIAKAKNASTVTLTEIAKVPAATGIVVNATAGTYNIPVLTEAADATTGNLLKPNLTATTLSSDYYTLAVDGSNNPIFKKSSGVGTLAAGKAYLDLTGSAAELNVDFGGNSADDQTTGISAIEHSTLNIEHSEVYNLSGQRISQPTKGLYIVNGKKVVVK